MRSKRADRHGVLNRSRISEALEMCMKHDGGLYGKAAVLLSELGGRVFPAPRPEKVRAL